MDRADEAFRRLQHHDGRQASATLHSMNERDTQDASRAEEGAASGTSARQRSRGVYLLPNLFTTGGLFAGFYAIIAASQEHFTSACIAVFIAGLLDTIDGRVARLTNTQSEFGAQYDSLADLISFGLAPSLVMYHWALESMRLDGAVPGKIGWIVAFLYVACAALRLARFNTQIGQVDKRWFIGLASPAAAGLMVSFVWAFHDFDFQGVDLRYVALGLTLVSALLMVAPVRYFSFKGGGPRSDRVPFLVPLLVLVVIAAIAVDPPSVLFAITVVYALSGPVYWMWRRGRSGTTTSAVIDSTDRKK